MGLLSEGGIWGKRTNEELYNLLDDVNVMQRIKIGKLKLEGDVRSENILFVYIPDGRRKVSRSKPTWRDGVQQYSETVGIWNWRTSAVHRDHWRSPF